MRHNSLAFIAPRPKTELWNSGFIKIQFLFSLTNTSMGTTRAGGNKYSECPGNGNAPPIRPLVDDLRILPKLSVPKIKEVNEMLSFPVWSVRASIDFENLVSVQSLNDCFGYQLPEDKVVLDKRGVPIQGWTLTTGRPILGNAPKKFAKRGTAQSGASGGLSELMPRKFKASRIPG